MCGNGWKRLETNVTAGNEWTWLEMAGNGWKLQKIARMAINAWKGLGMEGLECKKKNPGPECKNNLKKNHNVIIL